MGLLAWPPHVWSIHALDEEDYTFVVSCKHSLACCSTLLCPKFLLLVSYFLQLPLSHVPFGCLLLADSGIPSCIQVVVLVHFLSVLSYLHFASYYLLLCFCLRHAFPFFLFRLFYLPVSMCARYPCCTCRA